jgi:voltage-gated potassium channel
VLSLGLLAWVQLADLRWPDPLFQRLAALDLLLVVLLGAELLWRWRHAPDRRAFLRAHGWEALGLVPLYAEALSWARVTALLRVVRLLRVLHALARLRRAWGFARAVLAESRLLYTGSLTALVVLGMAAGVWALERGSNPSFAQFSEALWWAIVTASTVGYGDITPQTGAGRTLAGLLMLLGIGLIGVVASSLSNAVLAVGQAEQQRAAAAEGPASLAGELERLAALHAAGHLTDAEFSRAKARVLGGG